MSECEFHDWLTRRLAQRPGGRVLVGAGPDDCAHLDVTDMAGLAVSTDTIVENTHFLPDDDPLSIGWKAVASSVSDLAASGCRPLWGLVALTLRRGMGDRWAMRLMEGVIACAQRYGLAIVGGDTTSVYGPTSVNVTVIGAPYAERPISRGGACLGDVLAVTGFLGGSLAGRHMRPEPRFPEIERILSLVPVHACMDVSDGLSLDLHRLLSASNVGADVEEAEIPISPAAFKMAETSGRAPLDHALNDGEDFELLFAVAPADWKKLAAAWPGTGLKTRLSRIGRVVAEQGLRLVAPDGAMRAVAPGGYVHEL